MNNIMRRLPMIILNLSVLIQARDNSQRFAGMRMENVTLEKQFHTDIKYRAGDDFQSGQNKMQHDRASREEYFNFTADEIAALLKSYGYKAVYFGNDDVDGWPFAGLGDMLLPPEDVLPELGHLGGRRANLVVKRHLWLDDHGNAVVWYFYDTKTNASKKIFSRAVQSWTEQTCLVFTQMKPKSCDAKITGHGALCVADEGGCSSPVGNNFKVPWFANKSTPVSMAKGGCEDVEGAHEIGHSLGLAHEQGRSDRDKFIHCNYQNFRVNVGEGVTEAYASRWAQAIKHCKDLFNDLPKPYDPMSVMQYGTTDYGGGDDLPILVHKNAFYQYMFDYRRRAGYFQSHYDIYIINLGYGCGAKWKKACEKNQKDAPKCANYGFLNKDCKCTCPNGFSGATCSTKSGPLYPPLHRAKLQRTITEPGLFDLEGKGMNDDDKGFFKPYFKTYHFFTIEVKAPKDMRISIEVEQPFDKISTIYNLAREVVIRYDCELRVMIGYAPIGLLRTECRSSLLTNDTATERLVLRPRNSTVSLYGENTGILERDVAVSRMAMEFKLHVSFIQRPEHKLTVEPKYTLGAEAMTKIKNHPFVAALVILGLAGTIIAVCLFVALHRKKTAVAKAESAADQKPQPECSASDASSSQSDSSEESVALCNAM